MTYARTLVPTTQNDGRDDVSLTLTYKGVTYDASGCIADLTITQDFDGVRLQSRQTLTLVLEDAKVVATVRTKELVR